MCGFFFVIMFFFGLFGLKETRGVMSGLAIDELKNDWCKYVKDAHAGDARKVCGAHEVIDELAIVGRT